MKKVAGIAAFVFCVCFSSTSFAQDEQASCGAASILGDMNVMVLPLHNVGGDSEIGGNSTWIRVDAKLKNMGPYALLSGVVFIQERGGDGSRFHGYFSKRIDLSRVNVPGCRTRDFEVTGKLDAHSAKNHHGWVRYRHGSGIVNSAECVADVKGDDTGYLGCDIRFNAYRVKRVRIPQNTAVCNDVVVPVGRIDVTNLLHAHRGDTEIDGNNPTIKIYWEKTLSTGNSEISLLIRVNVLEPVGDNTTFERRVKKTFPFTLTPGCKPAASKLGGNSISRRGGRNNHKWTLYGGKGLLREAECLSDTRGDDAGKLGCRLWFHDIVIETSP